MQPTRVELILVAVVAIIMGTHRDAAAVSPSSVVLIVADDLGYGELGCYGQQQIATPHLDRMAAEGLRFTQFYAGAPVCAPSRCVLMTGQHAGHAHVRGNAEGPPHGPMRVQSLFDEQTTLAELLKPAGYRSALIGKWGLGEHNETGFPLRQGFDEFVGYLNQVHAHNAYPEFLWDGGARLPLGNTVRRSPRTYGGFTGGYATRRAVYAQDVLMERAIRFATQDHAGPFFLLLSVTLPHANNEASAMIGNGAETPSLGRYADKPWPEPDKGHAAMITRLDADVGRLLGALRDSGAAKETLVLFTSDNGPHAESGHDPQRFRSAGPLRGLKRSLYEGGIRVPLIAWRPGIITAGGESDHVAYFGDLMATLAETAGVAAPPGLDSLSFAPTLRGEPDQQRRHEHLYWEHYGQGGRQAVRFGDFKAIRQPGFDGPVELYDLAADPGERHNLAPQRPELVRRAVKLIDESHTPHPNWKL